MSIQYVTDEQGTPVAVQVPIAEWDALLAKVRALEPERGDTEYLLGSPAMRERLMASMKSEDHVPWEAVRDALGI